MGTWAWRNARDEQGTFFSGQAWISTLKKLCKSQSQCNACRENRMVNTKEPLISHQVPWQSVATDIFTLDEEIYLVVTDYYSRYFDFKRLRDLKASVINQKTFSRQRIPAKMVSDSGPNNNASREFAKFANKIKSLSPRIKWSRREDGSDWK